LPSLVIPNPIPFKDSSRWRLCFKQHRPTLGASQMSYSDSHKDSVTGGKSCSFRQLAAEVRWAGKHRLDNTQSPPSFVCFVPLAAKSSSSPQKAQEAQKIGTHSLPFVTEWLRTCCPIPCVLCVLCGCSFHSSDPEPVEANFPLRLRHVRLPVFSVFSVALCEIIPHTEPRRHRGSFEIAVDGPAMPSFIVARPVTASPPATPTAADHP
jgi:hypothetical protein